MSMVLVKVEHWRCGEPAGTTVMWAPEGTDETQFDRDVDVAERMVLDAAARLNAAGVPRHDPSFGWWPETPDASFLAGHSYLTVAEVQELWNKEQADKRAEHQLLRAAHRDFADHMHDLGYLYFFEHDPVLSTVVDWGHQHGSVITYGGLLPDSPRSKDLFKAKEGAD